MYFHFNYIFLLRITNMVIKIFWSKLHIRCATMLFITRKVSCSFDLSPLKHFFRFKLFDVEKEKFSAPVFEIILRLESVNSIARVFEFSLSSSSEDSCFRSFQAISKTEITSLALAGTYARCRFSPLEHNETSNVTTNRLNETNDETFRERQETMLHFCGSFVFNLYRHRLCDCNASSDLNIWLEILHSLLPLLFI